MTGKRVMVVGGTGKIGKHLVPKIARLGNAINATYSPYGTNGRAGAARQTAQDANAGSTGPGHGVQRAVTKGSANYRNTAWDLVDAVKEGGVKLAELKPAELPEEMREMTPAQREKYVSEKAQQRAEVQQQIAQLSAERKKYVAAKLKEQAGNDQKDTLGSALIKACHKQAAKKNFEIEEKTEE